jgi:hypothetical protein
MAGPSLMVVVMPGVVVPGMIVRRMIMGRPRRQTKTAGVEIALRRRDEFVPAGFRAEVVGPAAMLGRPPGRCRVDTHAADGVRFASARFGAVG